MLFTNVVEIVLNWNLVILVVKIAIFMMILGIIEEMILDFTLDLIEHEDSLINFVV